MTGGVSANRCRPVSNSSCARPTEGREIQIARHCMAGRLKDLDPQILTISPSPRMAVLDEAVQHLGPPRTEVTHWAAVAATAN